MKTVATTLAVASAFTAVLGQSSAPIIQSPASLVVCQPALLSFSGGQAPYYISVLPPSQPSAAAIEQFPAQEGNSFTWIVNLAAGQSITLAIRDSTGAINYSSELPIQAGTDTSCIGQSVSGTGSSTPGGASTSGASNSLSTRSTVSVTTSGSSTITGTNSNPTTAPTSTSAARTSSNASGANQSNTSAGVSTTAAPTGAASASYMANVAGVFGLAAAVAYFA